MTLVIENLEEALIITFFVFIMMMVVDYVNVLTKGRLGGMVHGGRPRQYGIATALGVMPGCLGSYLNVSFYVKGLLSFGAIAGGMVATFGDEAFVMFSLFPETTLLLMGVLFVLGLLSSYVFDWLAPHMKIERCQDCETLAPHAHAECRHTSFKEFYNQLRRPSFVRFLLVGFLAAGLYVTLFTTTHPWDWERVTLVGLTFVGLGIILTVPDHYLQEHIWTHIAKKHLWKIFLWSLGALCLVYVGLESFQLSEFAKTHTVWILLLAVAIGIIPSSGPHLIFVMMFAKGLVPFSVLLASSIVQEGHGLIPLLSYSVKDSVVIKVYKVAIGLLVGGVLFGLGL